MAESTLSLPRVELNRRLAFYLGWGRKASAAEGLSANQALQVDDARILGERDFLTAYNWSFLHPRVDFVLWASVAVSAAVTVTQSTGTLTAAGGTPFLSSMIGKTIAVTTEGSRVVTAYTSPTQVTVTPATTFATPRTFSIASNGVYRLPDNFGGMESRRIRFVRGYGQSGYIDIKARNLIDLNWQVQTSTGPPVIAATDAVSFDGPTGRRFDLMVAPVPDRNYTASFRYHSLVDAMVDGSYVIGGMPYSEALACCCLNAAERTFNNDQRTEQERRDRALRSAIEHDQRFHEDARLGPTTWSWLDQESGVGDRIGSFQIQGEPLVNIGY
ncbi:MAG TPA: hypothetical protein VJL29_14560 [Thermoguttaceae bacterium]|nr:hypothetical protein [Thermoguttaceae bacterium]